MSQPFGVNFLNLEYFFNRIYQFLTGGFGTGDLSGLISFLTILFIFLMFLSALLIIGIAYFRHRTNEVRKEEAIKFGSLLPSEIEAKPLSNTRWDNLQTYLESDNESDWKLAIIEADKLLDELVTKMGYQGDNLGERLKAIEPSDFLSLQAAWEAHKMRNRIAHEQGLRLSRRDVNRVIAQYDQVFREFQFI
ncbi:MAG: hypothetical protein Q7T49_01665 [bacterium]|nr:hypothetical protein [bacterium]